MLIKTEIPGFVLKQEPSTPPSLNDGSEDNMGTMSVRSRTLWPTLELANGDIYFFDRKRLELKNIAIGQKLKPSRLKTLKLKNYQKTLKSDDVSTFTQRHFQVKMNKKKLFEYKYTKNKSLENKKIGTQCVHGRTCNV